MYRVGIDIGGTFTDMHKLGPDFKTITDFRKNNRQAFKGVFRQFVMLCKGLGLVGGELVALDGSKFKAVHSGQRNFSQNKLERRLKELDQKVQRYLDEMEQADQSPNDPPVDKEDLKHKIDQLRERKGRYEELLNELNESGQKQVSLTDPDSRAMALTPRGEVSDNVQTAVDQKHHLIVDQEVTNEVLDNHQLFTMAHKTRQMLGQNELQVVADMSQSMPWIAEEAGLFRKYELEFQLVYISSAPMVTAALLGGDAQIAISGGEAIVRAHAQGATDLVFVASAKNTLTHSILGKSELKKPEDLKGKKLGVSRLGSNSHYFVIQALRKSGMAARSHFFASAGWEIAHSSNSDASTPSRLA